MITYNNKKLKEILKSLKKNRSDFRADIGIQNDVTVKRWIEGEDVYISRITQICNMYKLNITDFFLEDGQEIKMTEKQIELVSDSDSTNILLAKRDKEIAELRLKCQDDIYAIREEQHRQEIAHVREVADLTVRIREEERIRLFEQHEQDRLKYKKEMDEVRNKTEQLLSAKDQENSLLQQKLNNLQLEYKELEMSMGTAGSIYKTPIALAEPTTTPYNKQRK